MSLLATLFTCIHWYWYYNTGIQTDMATTFVSSSCYRRGRVRSWKGTVAFGEARAVTGVGGGVHPVSPPIVRVLTVPCYLVLAGGVGVNGLCNEPEPSRCLGGSGSSGDPRLCGKSCG